MEQKSDPANTAVVVSMQKVSNKSELVVTTAQQHSFKGKKVFGTFHTTQSSNPIMQGLCGTAVRVASTSKGAVLQFIVPNWFNLQQSDLAEMNEQLKSGAFQLQFRSAMLH